MWLPKEWPIDVVFALWHPIYIQQLRMWLPKSWPAAILYLQKAPVNNVNNPFLLLFRHLVIAGKAQPSPENVGSYVHSRAFYIGICAASSVSLNRDKRVRPVYRLHMHGLPNPSTYQAKVSKTLQSFNQAEHTIFSMEWVSDTWHI